MKPHDKILYFLLTISIIISTASEIMAQVEDDNLLEISGKLLSDQRFLLNEENDWAWSENRLTLNLTKRISGSSKFYSEVWLRNIGLPQIGGVSDLYNKGIVDPYNLEVREAYVQINGFLSKNLDLTIGRQRLAWGTADQLNPTDNLNPYDLEDILDFGRHRGSDAVNLQYHFSNNYSFQVVFIPFFRPANMPLGIFSDALNPEMELPDGLVLNSYTDNVVMPRFNLKESLISALRLKGFVKGVDYSLSYVFGYDGLPFNTYNTFLPTAIPGSLNIDAEVSYLRTHILGADLATSIAGAGVWAEAALFLPGEDVIMTSDFTALFGSPVPITIDSVILEKSDPYLKFIVGADYFFADGSYLNLQYLHGFIHERGNENLNDYFFLQYEKSFFNQKLKIAPVGGGFIVNDWSDLKNNYALVYMPSINYQATPNAEIIVAPVIFEGKGDNIFAHLNEFNMFMMKLKYSF